MIGVGIFPTDEVIQVLPSPPGKNSTNDTFTHGRPHVFYNFSLPRFDILHYISPDIVISGCLMIVFQFSIYFLTFWLTN